MKDELGDRMKKQYESRTRYSLPRRTYTIIRLDGKAFHTFTRGMNRPYDENLMKIMDETAKYLCENIQGSRFAYTQSDEISILLTDFDKITTDAWYDGNIQKIVSVAASIATAKFNELMLIETFKKIDEYYDWQDTCFSGLVDIITKQNKLANFDARVFTIPDPIEVENYFIWRQKDAVRNSISMVAQSLYSHKELEGKTSSDKQDLIHEKGQNWNDMPEGFKRGRFVNYVYLFDLETSIEFQKCSPEGMTEEAAKRINEACSRGEWEIKPAADFLKDRDALRDIIPKITSE